LRAGARKGGVGACRFYYPALAKVGEGRWVWYNGITRGAIV
jgi:hypothetical protein